MNKDYVAEALKFLSGIGASYENLALCSYRLSQQAQTAEVVDLRTLLDAKAKPLADDFWSETVKRVFNDNGSTVRR